MLIIGGSSGLGFAAAEASIENGATVVISSSSQQKIDKAIERIKQSYPSAKDRISGYSADLGTQATLEKNVAELLEKTGGKLDHISTYALRTSDNMLTTTSSFSGRLPRQHHQTARRHQYRRCDQIHNGSLLCTYDAWQICQEIHEPRSKVIYRFDNRRHYRSTYTKLGLTSDRHVRCRRSYARSCTRPSTNSCQYCLSRCRRDRAMGSYEQRRIRAIQETYRKQYANWSTCTA